jgi:hypothetical protein
MAQVAINHLALVVAPEIRDPRGRIRLALGSLAIDEKVVLVDRREFNGKAHWEIGRTHFSPDLPLGWVPEFDRNGLPTLFPYQPDCPEASEVTVETLLALAPLEDLVCFGNRDLTLVGDIDCYLSQGDAVIAARWLSIDRYCTIDDLYGLHGEPVTNLLDGTSGDDHVTGRYVVHGHFDDPRSAECGWIPFGTSGPPLLPGEPGPVLVCRGIFFVTSVQPAAS